MSKVRGVRFLESEEKLIEEFLQKNPMLDFSTLAKVAILEFIKNPQMTLTPVGHSIRREKKDVRSTN